MCEIQACSCQRKGIARVICLKVQADQDRSKTRSTPAEAPFPHCWKPGRICNVPPTPARPNASRRKPEQDRSHGSRGRPAQVANHSSNFSLPRHPSFLDGRKGKLRSASQRQQLFAQSLRRQQRQSSASIGYLMLSFFTFHQACSFRVARDRRAQHHLT